MSGHFETYISAYMIQEPMNIVIFRPLQSLNQPKNGEPCEEASVSVDVGHQNQVENTYNYDTDGQHSGDDTQCGSSRMTHDFGQRRVVSACRVIVIILLPDTHQLPR